MKAYILLGHWRHETSEILGVFGGLPLAIKLYQSFCGWSKFSSDYNYYTIEYWEGNKRQHVYRVKNGEWV